MYREQKNIGEINVSHDCSGKNPIRSEEGASADICAGIFNETNFNYKVNREVRL